MDISDVFVKLKIELSIQTIKKIVQIKLKKKFSVIYLWFANFIFQQITEFANI